MDNDKTIWKSRDIRQLFTWTTWTCEPESTGGINQKIIFWKMNRHKNSFDQTVIDSDDEIQMENFQKKPKNSRVL